jgi:hypothetical protein
VSARNFSEHDTPAVGRHEATGKHRLWAYFSNKSGSSCVTAIITFACHTYFRAISATGIRQDIEVLLQDFSRYSPAPVVLAIPQFGSAREPKLLQ